MRHTASLKMLLIWLAVTFNEQALANEQLIDINGTKLNTVEAGVGHFTVIFESGFGSDLRHWRKVAPTISKTNKVVAYSRAGHGKSEPVVNPRGVIGSLKDFEAMIEAKSLKPPFVLVGHSFGGHIIRGYAAKHPKKIAGLVFVDPANESLIKRLKIVDEAKTLAFLDVFKNMVPTKYKAEEAMLAQIDQTGVLPFNVTVPDVPTVVLTSMKQEFPQFIIHSVAGKKIWRKLHAELFSQFSNGKHIVTSESGHNIALHNPKMVINSIEYVLTLAQQNEKQVSLSNKLIEANSQLSLGKLESAENTINKMVNELSLTVPEINDLGYLYLGKEDNPILASIIFKTNIARARDSSNVYDSYGESLLKLGNGKLAKQQFEKAIEIAKIKISKTSQSLNKADDRALKGYQKNLKKAYLLIESKQ